MERELNGPTEAVLGRTYARLQPSEGMPFPPNYAEEIAPGLVRTLAFDHPGHIQVMSDEHVRRHGLDRLHDAGLRNLTTQLQTAEYLQDEGVHLLEGSEYVGSLVLVLPWVIETVTGAAAPQQGALVAMPGRSQLIFHVIRDPDEVWHARDKMMWLAGKWYSEHTHQISPSVYWWRPEDAGSLEPVLESDDFTDMMIDFTADHAMGKRQPEADQAGSDAGLTGEQGERLQRLVRRSPVLTGMRVEMYDDFVQIVEPRPLRIGLGPLVDSVAKAPDARWLELVDEYLTTSLELNAAAERELIGPTEPLLTRVYLNVYPSLGHPPDCGYAEEIAPKLFRVLEFDGRPDQVLTMKDEHVRWHDVGELERAGRLNLLREFPDDVADSDGVYLLTGSMFTAATVFMLPEVVERTTGVGQLPDGALVAMPHQCQLLFHVLGTADRAMATELLADTAVRLYDDGRDSGAISPLVYWWRDGRLTQLD